MAAEGTTEHVMDAEVEYRSAGKVIRVSFLNGSYRLR
jgi:hypothetical protein